MQGIHVLLSILVIVWLITSSSTLPAVSAKLLSLENSPHKWWSFVTDAFVSNSSEQLFRNLFMGYMFGRVVENSESTKALWITYLMSAAGKVCDVSKFIAISSSHHPAATTVAI